MELLESLQDSERDSEKRRIELEVQNEELNPDDEDIITKIVEKLHKWFGKPEIDRAFLSWNEVISMKRKDNESIGEFILRYETAEAKLRCSATALPLLLLAIHLIQSLNVDEAERRLIVSNIKFDFISVFRFLTLCVIIDLDNRLAISVLRFAFVLFVNNIVS